MTIEEYFGDWCEYIDLDMANNIKNTLLKSSDIICPKLGNVFKCFRLCSFKELKVVFLGYGPYPDLVNNQPVATGLAFANYSTTPEKNYSSSLKVLKASISHYLCSDNNANFDPSLESWEKQGVLMLSSALSCEAGLMGTHSLLWRPFIASFLLSLSLTRTNIVYVLLGSVAQSFKEYINHKDNTVIECYHPVYYSRTRTLMPDIWIKVNKALLGYKEKEIRWFNT